MNKKNIDLAESNLEFKKKEYTLPNGTLDILNLTNAQITTQLEDYGYSEALIQEILSLKEILPSILNDIKETLGADSLWYPVFEAILKDYNSTNTIVLQLLNNKERPKLLEYLATLKPATKENVTEIEQRLTDSAKYPLYNEQPTKRAILDKYLTNSIESEKNELLTEPLINSLYLRAQEQEEAISTEIVNQTLILENIKSGFFEQLLTTLTEDSGIDIEPTLSGMRIKSTKSIFGKMRSNGLSFTQLTDIIGSRIIVNDIKDLQTTMGAIQEFVANHSQATIAENENRFRASETKPYRAIHYTIIWKDNDGNETCFELQLKSGKETLLGEIEHDVCYKKDIYNFSDNIAEYIASIYWGYRIASLQQLVGNDDLLQISEIKEIADE